MERKNKFIGKKSITEKTKLSGNSVKASRSASPITYIIFTLVAFALAFIIIKDVSLPSEVTLPFVILALMVLVISTFFNPDLSLLLLVAYVPFSKIFVGRFGSENVGVNLTNILLVLVILAWFVDCANKKHKMFQNTSLNIVVFFFCMWGFVTLIRAKFMYGSVYDFESYFILFKRWVTPILLYFIVLNMVRDRTTLKKVLFVMMVATFVIALMAIWDYMEGGDRGSIDASRIGGVFEQPNTLGGFFVYMMFFFLAFVLSYWKTVKYWLLLIPFIACFRGIMVTFSRGAYVAAGFGMTMMTFFKSRILFVIVVFLAIASLATPGVLPEGMRYRLASTFGGEQIVSTNVEDITDPSAGRRILIWQGAIEMIKDQPIFGFGYGVFPLVIGSYADVKEVDAHNTYLILAAEMGIPALILFLLILGMLIKNAWWIYRKTKDRYIKAFALGVLGGLFGLLAVNMFGSRLNAEEVSSYFWMYAGLTMAVVRMKQLKKIS